MQNVYNHVPYRRCPDGTSLTQKLKLFRRGKKLFFSLIYECVTKVFRDQSSFGTAYMTSILLSLLYFPLLRNPT